MAKKRDIFEREGAALGDKGITLLFDKETKRKDKEGAKETNYLKKLLGAAKRFSQRDSQTKKWNEKRERSKQRVLKLIQEKKRLRGVESRVDDFRVVTSFTTAVEYIRELLKKSLGSLYSAIVRERMKINIDLPGDKPKLQKRIIKALKELLGKEVFDALVTVEITPIPDEKALKKAITEKRVKLLRGTVVKHVTPSVKASKLS